MDLFQSNASGSRVHVSKTCGRKSEYADVNNALYTWYNLACSKNIFPMGPQLIEKARQIAEHLGHSEFKGSNGWLDKWKKRFNIRQMKISGESGDVSGPTVESWKERLPEIVANYSADDIWNMDETGLFWKALPDSGFGSKGKECKGGKKSKDRFTVALFVAASGKKEKPIVIWKSKNPRCFKKLNKGQLPVHYFSQKKAWMEGEIMEAILTKLNNRLSKNNRTILLMMDNAGCHPEGLKEKFSNIRVCFLPANTTSKLQPLDLGIIQNFKVHYRTLFLRHVIAKIDECDSASEVCKSVNVLVAIRWVDKAWSLVKEETIQKCFRKAGILDSTLSNVVQRDELDPFTALDAESESQLTDLIDMTMTGSKACSVEEYTSGEYSLPTCREMDDDNWEDTFIEDLCGESTVDMGTQDEDDEDEIEYIPKIKDYKELNEYLEEVQHFLQNRGHAMEAFKIGSVIDDVSCLRINAATTQTTLDSWIVSQY